MVITPYSLVLYIGSFFSLVLYWAVKKKFPFSHKINYLSLTILCVAFNNLFYGLEISFRELEYVIFIYKIEFFGIAFISLFYFLFLLQFTGYYEKLSIEFIIFLYIVPSVSIILNLSNGYHSLFYSNPEMVKNSPFDYISFDPGFWYRVQQFYDMVLMVSCFIVIFIKWKYSAKIFKKQLLILFFSLVFPFIIFFVPLFGWVPYGLDLVPYSSTLAMILIFLGLRNYMLFDVIPIARDFLFEQMSDGILIIDKQLRLIDNNKAMEKIFPDINQYISKKSLDYFEKYPQIKDIILSKDDSASVDFTLSKNDKVSFYSAVSTSLKNESNGNNQGKILVFRDITDLKFAELKILEQNKKLLDLNSQKDEFFSIISHDLRSPFMGLVGMAKFLYEDHKSMESEELEDILKSFVNTSNNLYDLVEDLLEWSIVQSDDIQVEFSSINLDKILRVCIQSFESILENKSLKINYQTSFYGDISGNKDMVSSLFRNLINNSVKFSHPNSKIDITLDKLNENIRISIQDYGIGIPENYKNNIFLLHKKTNQLGTRGEKSTGLGLPLVKKFVDIHKGKIEFESNERKGTTFNIYLPIS